MADLQIEKGNWLPLRKEILEALARYKLSEHERAILDEVIHLSYGYKQNDDEGRYCFYNTKSEFAAACGLYPIALDKAWDRLLEYQILYIDQKHKIIVFNKDFDTWKAPLKPAYNAKAQSVLRKRNFPISTADKASGDEAHAIMKKLYRQSEVLSELDKSYPNQIKKEEEKVIRIGQVLSESDKRIGYVLSESDKTTSEKANKDKASQSPKDIRSKDNIYIYKDLYQELGKIPGSIDIKKEEDKNYFEYIQSFDKEKIQVVLDEAKRRLKLETNSKDKLRRKSVLKFIAGGLENYDRLYVSKKPSKKLTPKEKAVAQGIKVIRAYRVHPDMIPSKRQLSSLSKHYEQYTDYGELVNMTLEQFRQAIEGE